MQDITIRKRKVTGYAKRQDKKQTRPRHIIIFLIVVTILLIIVNLIGSHALRYDNGAVWVHRTAPVSVKMVHQSEVDTKEVLSAMYPKKEVKKAYFDHSKVMAQREAKYRPLIEKYFPEEPEIMLAISKAESSLNQNAINYNCYYDAKGLVHSTRPKGGVSKSCKAGHEKYSWSKDGCLMQVNSTHKEDISNIDTCMKMARKIYDTQGKKAWVAYNSGSYKKYLTQSN